MTWAAMKRPASLSSRGDRWLADRGFRPRRQNCLVIARVSGRVGEWPHFHCICDFFVALFQENLGNPPAAADRAAFALLEKQESMITRSNAAGWQAAWCAACREPSTKERIMPVCAYITISAKLWTISLKRPFSCSTASVGRSTSNCSTIWKTDGVFESHTIAEGWR